MSRLDELITELCPDGVEYKAIKSCVEKIANIKWSDHIGEHFRYIDLTSVNRDTHQIEDTLSINMNNAPSRAQQLVKENDVLLGATRPLLKRYCIVPADYDGDICSTGFCVLRAIDNIVLPRYLYHIISSTEFFSYVEKYQKGASYPAIADADTKNYRFPVPPLPVQQEIVRILDHFTELTAELQKQLDAELTARKKQYEYYRDNLLLSHETTEYTVQDLIDLKMIDEPMDGNHGELHPKKADYVSSGVPFIMANNLVNGSLDYDNCAFITEKQAATLRKGFAKPGDVLLTHKGTIGRTAIVPESFSSIVLTPQVTYYRIKKGIDNRYLKHYFDSAPFQAQITDIAGLGGTRAYIGITAQRALRIRMPSLEDQRDISLKQECFDKLYNNLTSGLPAEIAARQKQYEYYRDKLLTFKELKKS